MASQIDPNYLDAHMNLAAVYFQTRDYKNALASLERARSLSPNNPSIEQSIVTIQNLLKAPATK